jgi:hypothetical protein
MNNSIRIGLLVLGAVVAALPHAALASLPVGYAIVGCVKGDKFYSGGSVSPSLAGSPIKALDGKTVRIEGYLSPGDRFQAGALFIVDEECREELHKRYFLCDPCQTLPDAPPSRMVPRKEKGVPAQAPPEAIKQFDDLPRTMRAIR